MRIVTHAPRFKNRGSAGFIKNLSVTAFREYRVLVSITEGCHRSWLEISAFNRITRNPQRLCNVAASREARGRVGPAGDRLSCLSLFSAQTRSLTAQGLLSLGVL